MTIFDEQPPSLTDDDVSEILYWSGIEYEENPLMRAGSRRNALRWANAFGAKVLAEMIRRGLIDPGEDPIGALERLDDT